MSDILPEIEKPTPTPFVPKTYLLSVQRRFTAVDDLDARLIMHEVLRNLALEDAAGTRVTLPEGDEIKFQEVSKSGPPRRLPI